MCVAGVVCISARLYTGLIRTAQLLHQEAAAWALDRKESRHLFARGPRLSGEDLPHPRSPATAQQSRCHLLWAHLGGQGAAG